MERRGWRGAGSHFAPKAGSFAKGTSGTGTAGSTMRESRKPQTDTPSSVGLQAQCAPARLFRDSRTFSSAACVAGCFHSTAQHLRKSKSVCVAFPPSISRPPLGPAPPAPRDREMPPRGWFAGFMFTRSRCCGRALTSPAWCIVLIWLWGLGLFLDERGREKNPTHPARPVGAGWGHASCPRAGRGRPNARGVLESSWRGERGAGRLP